METRLVDECLASGDLGLGAGLKPGGIPHCTVLDTDYGDCCSCSGDGIGNGNFSHDCKLTSATGVSIHRLTTHSCTNESDRKSECSEEEFPVYADVEYGTSLKQQKRIFNQNLGTILKSHGVKDYSDTNGSEPNKVDHPVLRRLSSEEVGRKLTESLEEIEELKLDLETCERRLDAKYKAIAILKQQAEEFRAEQKENEKKTQEFSHELLKISESCGGGPVGSCRMKHSGGGDGGGGVTNDETNEKLIYTDPRLPRICKENAELMIVLESRSAEMKRIMSQKMALARERDELLALIDVQEKIKYQQSQSSASNDEFFAFTSTELAVLGACKCRRTNPKPCICAHAAAVLRREVIKLREEILMYKKRRDEAYFTVDAYRKAFEEQLQKSKYLTLKLAELSVPGPSKYIKAKAAIKWLLSTINDDEPLPVCKESEPSTDSAYLSTQNNTPTLCDRELVIVLTDMLHEKKEALAHQKLAAQILGDRVKELESQLASDNSSVQNNESVE
ncbi:hypothetical protein ScPMuIL_001890 [Solemya velum]